MEASYKEIRYCWYFHEKTVVMDRIILGICMTFLFGCGKQSDTSENKYVMVIPSSKLEQLLVLPKDTVLEYYDLSNDFLMEQPDLSGYTIHSLNLSHNYLDTLILPSLPQELEKLDLSYNVFSFFSVDSVNCIRELDLSHNCLRLFNLVYYVDRIDLSYNNLSLVGLFWTNRLFTLKHKYRSDAECKNMAYLNISHNLRLKHLVQFEPTKIDTIIRNDIADDEELVEVLKYMSSQWGHYIKK